MKKLFLSLVLLTVVMLSSCTNKVDTSSFSEDFIKYEALDEAYYSVFEVYNTFDEIEPKIASGTHYLFTGKPTCSYCQIYLPLVAKYAYENDLKIIYYNSDSEKDGYVNYDDELFTVFDENNGYYKLVNLLAKYDTNITVEGSDLGYCRLRTLPNKDEVYWLYVPRLFKFVDGVPTKNCFKVNSDENTNVEEHTLSSELTEVFISEMNENTK